MVMVGALALSGWPLCFLYCVCHLIHCVCTLIVAPSAINIRIYILRFEHHLPVQSSCEYRSCTNAYINYLIYEKYNALDGKKKHQSFHHTSPLTNGQHLDLGDEIQDNQERTINSCLLAMLYTKTL